MSSSTASGKPVASTGTNTVAASLPSSDSNRLEVTTRELRSFTA